jgi:DNA-3-methyladenine glycosylase II
MYLTTLYPKAPYRFDLMLDILSRFAHPTLDIVRDGAYWRALRFENGMALVRVTSQGTVDSPALDVHLAAETGNVDADVLLDTVKAILPIDLDKTRFYETARQDSALWGLVEPLIGLPQLRTASAFEALMQTVIEQQIAWVAAQKAQHWLVRWAGNCIEYDGATFYAFPTAEQIAKASVDDLIPLKITFKRMALMIELARQVVEGQLELEALRQQTAEAAYNYLLGIKGIGHWTAVVTLERAFGHLNHVAHNDVALQAAVNRFFYGGDGRIPAEQLKATFERYGEFGGIAAHYTLMRWVLERYSVNGQNGSY